MAFIGETIDITDVAPADFSAIPTGDYVAAITDSDIKESKAGSKYMSLRFEIMEGQYQHRMVWHNLNIWHPNDKAREIALRELSAICMAVGNIKQINNTTQLHDLPMKIRVEFVPESNGYSEKNRVKKWTALSATPPTPKPAAAAKSEKIQPWKRTAAAAID